ncbi:hypothetical protein [Roseomonas elaeocarpi]|uniref:C4-dicarboxylate ABC transporter substrate-binding protein n=1 Tax=Roseomonas elaeocarpi TaxID=907779 RepID=A0ABV6JQZ6_9PROT
MRRRHIAAFAFGAAVLVGSGTARAQDRQGAIVFAAAGVANAMKALGGSSRRFGLRVQ